MKRIIYILTAIATMILSASCQKDTDRLLDTLVGDWHYSAEESGVKEDIWISFTADGTFQLYQKVGDGPYWLSTGEFTLDSQAKLLTGVYSDRYPWKYSYKIAVGAKSLTLAAVELDTYIMVCDRATVPAEVSEKALPLTKAESIERYL